MGHINRNSLNNSLNPYIDTMTQCVREDCICEKSPVKHRLFKRMLFWGISFFCIIAVYALFGMGLGTFLYFDTFR